MLERVVRKAIQRAQADLEKELELWQDHTSRSNPWRVQSETMHPIHDLLIEELEADFRAYAFQ